MRIASLSRLLAVLSLFTLVLEVFPNPALAVDWEDLCRNTVAKFQGISQQDVAQARSELEAAVRRLEVRFERAGPEVAGWKAYLHWADLKEQLARPSPDVGLLEKILVRLTAGHEGLGLSCFADVRRGLQSYILRVRLAGDPNARANLEKVLENLPSLLREYEASGAATTASAIQDILDWLELTGQAADLRAAVHRAFSQPNALVQIQGSFLDSAFKAPVDVTEDVREIIVGADVRGKGHIVGTRSIDLRPDSKRAAFEIVVTGTIRSQTVGYKGPARVYSQSESPFTARKTVFITSEAVSFGPAVCSAKTDSHIQDVDMNCGGACAERIGWRQALKQEPLAEWEAARKAERRVARRVDQEADPQLRQVAQRYQARVRQPLLDRGLFPARFDLSTTEETLHLVALQLGRGGLGAASLPNLQKQGTIVVQVHQTWFNNLVEGFLGGMILKEERFQEMLKDLLGRLPEELEPESEEEPWTVRFYNRRPIAVSFSDGYLSVEFRGETYWKGDRSYPGMDVQAKYRIAKESAEGGEQIVLVREDRLSVLPPGFDPKTESLSVRQQTIRRLLERRFEKIFRERIVLEPIKLEGEWAKAGPLVVSELETHQGWLVAVLNPAPQPKPAQ